VNEPPSAAFERTRLAWSRTVLTALVVGILGGRLAVETLPASVAAVLVALLSIVWLGLFAAARRRIRRLDAAVATPPVRTFQLVVGLIAALVAVSGILVLRVG
jgi:uncharacterized membrane protein YidH (DUF202 family)